jgi:hypothetical protein
MGYWCPPQSSKLLETCVPGLVGSIPTQSRQRSYSRKGLTMIDSVIVAVD